MAVDSDKKTSLISKDTFKTVEDAFREIEAGEKRAIKVFKDGLKQAAEQIAKAQESAMRQAIKRWTKDQLELERAGVEDLESYKKKFLNDRIKEEQDKRLELINSLYKKEVEASTKSAQARQKQQAIANQEINQAWLKKYAELEGSGQTLTPEQQNDKKAKQEELDLAKKTLQEQTKQTALTKTLSGLMSQTLNAVNVGIDTYAKYQGGINARLQGASLGGTMAERLKYGTNTFGVLESRLRTATGINPYVKTETMLNNLDELVKSGIAANVEQRAFLNTIKDSIADTFDAANASLLRIVRLQQNDSTAARLGMEAYLTKFLNQMVENTEYLNQTFDDVESALVEASSQMTMQASTEFEYVVQKWLGALTGTGLSETTASKLAEAIGYLGSGNVSGFGTSDVQGLLTMAASRANLNIGEILNTGLSASTTNTLLNALANYMVEIGSNKNNVVRSQLAQTFGLNISDITAAQQLSKDFATIYRNMLSYQGMYGALNQEMLEVPGRLSMSEMIQNVFDNSMFSMASRIAGNPALASIWKVTDMIQSTTGGINIPFINTFFGGIDLNASVEQLIKLGIVGISSLGMIGDVISGLGSSLVPSTMLQKLGIFSGNTAIRRGGGLTTMLSGFTESSSTYVGQGSGSDIYQQTLQGSSEEAKNNEILSPQEDEEDTKALPNIWNYLNSSFDPAFKELLDVVKDLRNTVVNGEVEVRDLNHNAFIV